MKTNYPRPRVITPRSKIGCWIAAAIGIAFPIWIGYSLIEARHASRSMSERSATFSVGKELSSAFLVYAGDNDERLPLAKNWAVALGENEVNEAQGKVQLRDEHGKLGAFAMNRAASGFHMFPMEDKDSVLIFVSSQNGPSPVGGKSDLLRQGRTRLAMGFSLSGYSLNRNHNLWRWDMPTPKKEVPNTKY